MISPYAKSMKQKQNHRHRIQTGGLPEEGLQEGWSERLVLAVSALYTEIDKQ